MQEGTWQNIALGADAPGVQARGTLAERGPFLHAWLKFRLPGNARVYMLTASIDLRQIEAALEQELAARMPTMPIEAAVSGGRIARKIKRKIKTAAKKIAHSKLVKAVVSVAKKAFNNPLIKAALMATGVGAAVVATAAAARVAAKAMKGSVKAKALLKSIAHKAKRGDPDALRAARLVKAGVKLTGLMPHLNIAVSPQTRAAGEPAYLAAFAGACCGFDANAPMPPSPTRDHVSDDQELDAFKEFAASGCFEGTRYLASRLSATSGRAWVHPAPTGGSLARGHQAMVARALASA